MKSKFSRILGVGLSIMLIASLMVFAAPVSAAALAWGDEDDVPRESNMMIVPDSDITSVAASGDTIYAATDESHGGLYRTTDGGATWTSANTSKFYPAGVDIMLVAVAPDDPDVVIIATSDNKVVYSRKGGSKWVDLGTPSTGATISAIDVSAGPTYYVAVGGTDGTDAEMYTKKLTTGQSWTARAGGSFTPNQDAVKAVKFSPNFQTDKIITVVSGNNTAAYFQVFFHEAGAYTWNDEIPYYSGDGYGTGISLGAWTTPATLASASIALAPTYLGTDESTRLAFIGVATTTPEGGVIRLTDSIVKSFTTWSDGEEGPIHSVAYHQSAVLLAGDYNDNQVYRALTPMAIDPKFERLNTYKQPGGTDLTVVEWAGDIALVGTSGDESAFAVSNDNGNSFNDISLIDTALTNMSDVGVLADGSMVYLASYDGNDSSIWLRAPSWKRVLSLKDRINGKEASIIRVAPDDGNTVYVAFKDALDVYVSKNAGRTSWKYVPCYKLTGIQDMAAESSDVSYAVDTSGVSKTVNAGASWGTAVNPGLTGDICIVASIDVDKLIVGSTNGYLSYSTDGNVSWTGIGQQIESGALLTQVIASGLTNDDYIYAASSKPDTKVVRWKIGASTDWTDMVAPTSVGYGAYGIVLHEGVLYVDNSDSVANSEVLMTFDPTADTVTWSTLPSAGETFDTAPSALRVSAGSVKLWAIDTTSNRLFSYTYRSATIYSIDRRLDLNPPTLHK